MDHYSTQNNHDETCGLLANLNQHPLLPPNRRWTCQCQRVDELWSCSHPTLGVTSCLREVHMQNGARVEVCGVVAAGDDEEREDWTGRSPQVGQVLINATWTIHFEIPTHVMHWRCLTTIQCIWLGVLMNLKAQGSGTDDGLKVEMAGEEVGQEKLQSETEKNRKENLTFPDANKKCSRCVFLPPQPLWYERWSISWNFEYTSQNVLHTLDNEQLNKKIMPVSKVNGPSAEYTTQPEWGPSANHYKFITFPQ